MHPHAAKAFLVTRGASSSKPQSCEGAAHRFLHLNAESRPLRRPARGCVLAEDDASGQVGGGTPPAPE